MCKARMEVEVVTIGTQDTTLLIYDTLASPPRAGILDRHLPFDELRHLGFREVVYTNGLRGEFGQRFSWTLVGNEGKPPIR